MHDIKIIELGYQNILSVGANPIIVNFKDVKNLFITGQNGAGKSTLLTALSYNLYGKADRDIVKGNLLNRTNKRDLYTYTILNINGKEYKIERGMKPDILKVTENGIEWLESSSKVDYDKRIVELLGCDVNTFHKLVVISKTNYDSIMNMKASERRNFVENILDIGVFTQIQTHAKEIVKELKTKISILENDVSTKKSYIDRDIGRLEQAKTQNALNIDNTKISISDIIGREMPRLANQKIQDIKFIESEINLLESTDNSSEKERIKAEISSNQNALKLLKDNLENTKFSQNDYDAINNELSTKTKLYNEKNKEYNNTQVSLNIIVKDGKDIKNKLDNIDADSKCPSCKQTLLNEDLKNELQEQRNKLSNEYLNTKSTHDKLKIEIEEINIDIDKLKQDINLMQQNKMSYNNNLREITNLENSIKLLEEKDLDSIKNSKIHVLKERLQNTHNKDYLYEVNIKLDNLNQKLKDLENNVFDGSSIENDKEALKEKEVELFSLLNDMKHEQYLVNIFDDKGIKSNVIDMFIPFLNSRINYYVEKFGLYIDFRLDKNFNEKILVDYVDELTYNGLSEGEKQRVDLAITFAFLDVARSRNYASFNLLFLDDMTGHLDDSGVNNILELLEHDMTNTTPIMVNHDQDKYQHIFYKIIRFIKKGKFSQMEIM